MGGVLSATSSQLDQASVPDVSWRWRPPLIRIKASGPAGKMVVLMKVTPLRLAALWFPIAAVLVVGGSSPRVQAADSDTVKKLFADPPREYASAPLWVWNDLLTEAQVRETMRDLAGQKVMQVFVHPRPGLMTPYLSADWFRLWKVALDEAAKLDMNVWIYDENSYPSGFAGGWVPEVMPESRGMGLVLKESKAAPKWSDQLVAVYRLEADRLESVTGKVKAGENLPEARYMTATIQRAGNSPWHGDRCYVNLLTPGVTEKFIEVTLEAYKREIGDQFGQRVPGVFTDEPNIRPAGGFPWCPDLPEQFQKRWGYDLLDHLPSLSLEIGDWRRIRHNYFCLLNELFIERWGKPMYEWCGRNGLDFTGHYWDHEWPHCIGVPDNMAMAAWQHRPGVDTLMNQYAENTHAQFGNVRYCREVSSIANQLGRKRTLVELYGAGGWDLRFEDMKRIGDWLQVLGINTMDEHLSYITLRGARKRDHPQSFSYHEPWWEAYHVSAQYLTRLSAVMSQGEQVNRVLVIEPTTTAWMYQGNEARLREIGDSFFNLLMALEAAQVEYDLGCEDVIARWGKPAGERRERPARLGGGEYHAKLQVGQRVYDRVVVPPMCENLNASVERLLTNTFATRRYGRALLPGRRIDGLEQSYDRVVTEQQVGTLETLLRRIPEELKGPSAEGFAVERVPGDPGILFHHRRILEDGQVLLLVNSSLEHRSAGLVRTPLKGVEKWDLHRGAVEPYPFVRLESGCSARFDLPPSGSLLLFLTDKPAARDDWPAERLHTIAARGPTEVRRVEPNVLTLDYVDITTAGETRTNQHFYAANQFAWQKNGMTRNPWDSAVQFKNELIRVTFPPESGFEALYRFTIDEAVPANLEIVIERPDLYSITCNGQPVAAEAEPAAVDSSLRPDAPLPAGTQTVAFKRWWLDKAFGCIPLGSVARVGENVVTLKARPFTIFHELEPAYVRGDFTLKPAGKGFVIAADRPLSLKTVEPALAHGNSPDGAMWLSGGIGFTPGVNDRAPFVTFDLGQAVDLAAIRVWNYGESNVRDLTARGAKRIRISAGASSQGLGVLGTSEVAKAGTTGLFEDLPVRAPGVRFVKIEFLANHADVAFPANGEPPDNGFVGLAEVRFLAANGSEVRRVAIAQVSSELTSFRRVAAHLVDGSGLRGARPGWNEQGHPFYAHGVAYRQRFDVAEKRGRLVVSLPDWYGSVARVDVNGKRAGYIAAPPWECDVTELVTPGENTIEVVVFGTLKNTLGPHHGGHALGSAWPGMFQNGPKDGPPPGRQYSTVGYGLFEPFVLKRVELVETAGR